MNPMITMFAIVYLYTGAPNHSSFSLLDRMASQPAASGASRPATVQMRGQPVSQQSSCCS
jgi:hypothetical protein